MKNKPPCIRDIYKFRKTGCPQQMWDGEAGCTAWLEMTYVNDDASKGPIIVKACLDMVTLDINLKMLRLLEGNQHAVESLRNGLCEDVNGRTEPKADPGVVHLMQLLTMSHNKLLD